jgi:hypothetical protein
MIAEASTRFPSDGVDKERTATDGNEKVGTKWKGVYVHTHRGFCEMRDHPFLP